jgi:hypothetical protein
MNTADKKVSLEIPLNTQMKIFAFLFQENYSMSELFSGVREVGYYTKTKKNKGKAIMKGVEQAENGKYNDNNPPSSSQSQNNATQNQQSQ